MKIHVPPIKCQGIKTKLVEWIKSCVSFDDSGTWIEPFTGSGVVGFNIRPKKAIFADINPHIINFYNAIKVGFVTAEKAKLFLETEGEILAQQGQDHFYLIRDRFNQSHDPLDFLFLSRASFNGVMRFNKKGHYNVPFGHKPERFAKAYITKITNQIKYLSDIFQYYEWDFIRSDFREVLNQAEHGDFIYCDPPYFGRHTDYFNTWSVQDEDDLYELLKATSAKILLSTWHSNHYRVNQNLVRYQADFFIETREHFYHVGATEDHRQPMIEALIRNYPKSDNLNLSTDSAVQLQMLESTMPYHTS